MVAAAKLHPDRGPQPIPPVKTWLPGNPIRWLGFIPRGSAAEAMQGEGRIHHQLFPGPIPAELLQTSFFPLKGLECARIYSTFYCVRSRSSISREFILISTVWVRHLGVLAQKSHAAAGFVHCT
jgi:hypothetical protein